MRFMSRHRDADRHLNNPERFAQIAAASPSLPEGSSADCRVARVVALELVARAGFVRKLFQRVGVADNSKYEVAAASIAAPNRGKTHTKPSASGTAEIHRSHVGRAISGRHTFLGRTLFDRHKRQPHRLWIDDDIRTLFHDAQNGSGLASGVLIRPSVLGVAACKLYDRRAPRPQPPTRPRLNLSETSLVEMR